MRSSCDMFARNSDLYFEVSASSAAFSSSARRACSTSLFLRSTSTFCSASCLALSASSSLVCCSSVCRVCSSMVSCCDCCSRFSVRIVASIVLSTTPIDCVSCSRNVRCVVGERLQRGQLDHRLGLAFEQHRQHDDVLRRRRAEARVDARVVGGTSVSRMRCFSSAHWPTRPLPSCDPLGLIVAAARSRRAGAASARRRPSSAQHLIDRALLRVDQRRQLREQHLADGDEIALALQHARELARGSS